MTPRKQPSGKAPQWQYEYYSKFFLDPPEAAEIWSKPFKKLDPDEVMQDPLDEKLKAGILSERRFLGKGSDVNVLRAVWFLVHRIPDFPIIQDGVTIPLIPRDQGGAFKVLTTELSHTEPTLRGISQKALRGMYERVIRNYKEMTHFISEHREYRTPSTIMWRAVGELLRLDRLYRTERSEDSDDLSGPKDNTPQEEEQGEYKDETFSSSKPQRRHSSRSTTRVQESGRQQQLDAPQSRKRMADLTQPLEVAPAIKRVQRMEVPRATSYPTKGYDHPHKHARNASSPSRSPSVGSQASLSSGRDGNHYYTSTRDRPKVASRSHHRHYNGFGDRTTQAYERTGTAPPALSSSSHRRRSLSRNTMPDPFDYQDDAHGTAHMEDMIRALHRDTRIQMANMRSIIETQQAQLESLQDTLDTILRRIPMGPSPSSHQQQGRRSVSQLGTIDEQYYEQEDDRRHRRYSLNHDGPSHSSHRRA